MTWSDFGYTQGTTFTDTAVTTGGQYGYRVYATDGAKISDFSNATFVTLSPVVPSNFVAFAGALSGQINLTWETVTGASG